MSDDPVAAYLERVSRALGRFHRGAAGTWPRSRTTAVEAAVRSGLDADRAAHDAVKRFGSSAEVAAGLAHRDARTVATAGLIAGVAATWLAVTASSPAAPLRIVSPTRLVPRPVIGAIDLDRSGRIPAPPIGIRIDAYAPLSTGNAFVLAAFTSDGRPCYLTYIGRPGALAPFKGRGSDGGAVDCRRSPTPSLDMSLLGGSGLGGPFILYGAAPRAATALAITDAHGRTRMFSLPRIPVPGEPARQAVIVDLTRVGIHSCRGLAVLGRGRVLAREQFIPV
jgi:hypothetical protein